MFHAWAEISVSHQAENSAPKSLLRMPVHSMLITQKSQTATRPADPEKAPSEPTQEPTPEHPVGISKTSDTKRYSPELRRSPVSLDFSVPSYILT